MRRRPAVLIVAGFGLFVFLGISFLLARGLTGTSAERGKVLELLEAQARGDADAVLDALPVCRDEPAARGSPGSGPRRCGVPAPCRSSATSRASGCR